MRRRIMRWLSTVCSGLAHTISFFEDREMYRTADLIGIVYFHVDSIQWKLTKQNIRRLREKQRADVEKRAEG